MACRRKPTEAVVDTSERRARERVRAKENRQRDRQHIEYLQAKVAELSVQLRARTAPLPWKDVALALEERAADAIETNKELRRRTRQHRALLRSLVEWATACSTPTAASRLWGNSSFMLQVDWRNHTILEEGDARAASYLWLTERLYHNTAMAISQNDHWQSRVNVLESADDGVMCAVLRTSKSFTASVAECTEAQWRIYFRDPPAVQTDAVDTEVLSTLVDEGCIARLQEGGGGDGLYRLFVKPHESVIVVTNLQSDDRVPPPREPSASIFEPTHVLGWVVSTQVNDTTTCVVNHWVQFFRVPSNEASTETASDEGFRRQVEANLHSALAHCDGLLDEVLASVQAEGNLPCPSYASAHDLS